MQSDTSKQFRHKLEWLLVKGGFALFEMMSMEKASDIGGWIGRTLGPFMSVTKVAKRNLKAAFPDWDDAKIDKTVVDVWDNLGRYGAEYPHVSKMSQAEFFSRVELNGAEYLDEAEASDKPAIFFSAHMANWEMGLKSAWANGTPVNAIYRPLNNPLVDELANGYRNRYLEKGISKSAGGGRDLLQTMKNGENVAVLIDQKMSTGIPVPFFGRDAMTTTSIADFMLKYNAALYPAQVERIGHQPRFRITIGPKVEYTPTGDTAADVAAIMRHTHEWLEYWIKERPGQWFWLHKRWG